ncbi:MAG: hypothetical protein F4X05_03255, partial [Rhodothermaceae bacterium]|nr:hypothetical protein [Rhodothermaceae bacterium]
MKPFILVTAFGFLCVPPAASQLACDDWATQRFFWGATAEKVTNCIEAGADVAERDEYGRIPLHEAAASSSRPDVIAVLVAAGSDPNFRDTAGNTPLHASLSNWQGRVVMKLLELGADPSARNYQGQVADPTHCENWTTRAFAEIADADAVVACIESGWDVNTRSVEGDSPLHQAVRAKDSTKIALLLNAGADPNAANERGATALKIAIRENSTQRKVPPEAILDTTAVGNREKILPRYIYLDKASTIVALLLEAGADPNAKDQNSGKNPLYWAARRSDFSIIDMLIQSGVNLNASDNDGRTPLHEAAGHSYDSHVIGVLLEAGADIHARDNASRTPLHEAAGHHGDSHAIEVLVEAGADIHARNQSAMTPLHLAAAKNRALAPVAALVAVGADLNARDSDGNTPLHASWSNFNPEMVTTLLELGANPEARNNEGRPADPTHCENWSTREFAKWADADHVARCVESGWDINARGTLESTRLHDAIGNNNLTMVTALLEAGADVNALGYNGRTPLHAAAGRGDTVMIHVLLESGANLDARDDVLRTPLHEARQYPAAINAL